jgi:hypothetical protein
MLTLGKLVSQVEDTLPLYPRLGIVHAQRIRQHEADGKAGHGIAGELLALSAKEDTLPGLLERCDQIIQSPDKF